MGLETTNWVCLSNWELLVLGGQLEGLITLPGSGFLGLFSNSLRVDFSPGSSLTFDAAETPPICKFDILWDEDEFSNVAEDCPIDLSDITGKFSKELGFSKGAMLISIIIFSKSGGKSNSKIKTKKVLMKKCLQMQKHYETVI